MKREVAYFQTEPDQSKAFRGSRRNGYVGPIDLTIWNDHKPEQMTDPSMDGPLAIPPYRQTKGPRFLYSVRNRKRLEPFTKYRDQHIDNGDIFVLSDQSDEQLMLTTAQVLADQAGVHIADLSETRTKAVLRGALEGIPYVGKALAALILGPKRGE